MQERRKSVRRRVLKGGKIVYNHRFSAIDCTLRNLSETGAMLSVAGQYGVPDHFNLEFDAAPPRDCRVVWRHDDRLGVEFTPEATAA